ncbi:nucleoside-triphosphatase [uncultured Methanofollis sp.]|uniref:nucleoside-triphosphatase n=1 Tax=uncultured Methanofollis sp. TaxID=262500 RepID=UPI00262FB9D3|nr:nucleoside-triphosphatase [uncultured Methanofollis sp.]
MRDDGQEEGGGGRVLTVANLLVTGAPGTGKTTLVRRVAEGVPGVAGFYTVEVREEGRRTGFELVGFDGRRALLAHTGIRGRHRVGRYGVDVAAFEAFLAATAFSGAGVRLVVVDEIGKMECLSPRFRDLVVSLLDGPLPVVATVALRGDSFIEGLKARPDVRLVVVTEANRDALLPVLGQEAASLAGEGKAHMPPRRPGG